MKTRRRISKSKSGHYTAILLANDFTIFHCVMLDSVETARNVLETAERMLKDTGEIDVAAIPFHCTFHKGNLKYATA